MVYFLLHLLWTVCIKFNLNIVESAGEWHDKSMLFFSWLKTLDLICLVRWIAYISRLINWSCGKMIMLVFVGIFWLNLEVDINYTNLLLLKSWKNVHKFELQSSKMRTKNRKIFMHDNGGILHNVFHWVIAK